MDVPVLVAVTGPAEAALVTALGAARGVTVARRCADLSELLAAAQAGHGRAALISPDLRRLDRESLGRLAATGLAVVGVLPLGRTGGGGAGAVEATGHLLALGVNRHVAADAEGADVVMALDAALEELAADGGDLHARRSERGDPATALAPRPARVLPPDLADEAPPAVGHLVAVWGAPGAPGRTTVATTLASELAVLGGRGGPGDRARQVILADVDTWAPSTAQVLGLLDESAGIAAACRAAATGTLSTQRLEHLAPTVLPRLRVLTGLPRAERWPELGPRALEGLWATARVAARWVVADCSAPVEQDEEIAFDTAAPRRNAAALSALEAADTVLVVGSADPVGLARLVRALADLHEVVPFATVRVVVTKVRASAVGPAPHRRIREVLDRFAGVSEVVLIPDDRAGCDAALLAGRTLTEAAPTSPARTALRDLAADLVRAVTETEDPRTRGSAVPAAVRPVSRRRSLRPRSA